MIKSKKQMYIIVSAFAIILMLFTTTYAFFNYTRTGTANTIRTGRISFNTNQSETINLTNVFPIDRSSIGTDTTNTDEVVISITGDTTYTEGLEYLVTATDVNNTIGSGNNQKTVPISISVTASNLGTEDEEYFDNRENAQSHLYRVLANDVLVDDGRIAVGYIKSGATGVNGTITIKAYLDKDKIAITDTYDGNETDNMGTTTDWVDNRTVLTSAEWNSLQQNGVSFKVKVESNEGIWVEEIRTVNAIEYFGSEISNLRSDIKEIYFNKMGATRMQQAYDAAVVKANITYNNEGKVLAWLEENPDDNTKYNLYIASDGDTYLTTGNALFSNYSSLEKIEFNNVNLSRMNEAYGMFSQCSSLHTIDMSGLGNSHLSAISGMFQGCTNLHSVYMQNFNFGNVADMSYLFSNLTNLEIVDLSNSIANNLHMVEGMFNGCSNLQSVNLDNINTNALTDTTAMFYHCESLTTLNLSSFNISNVSLATSMFNGCTNLSKIYVSDTWNAQNVNISAGMFSGCTSLVGQASNTSYSFDSNDAIDKTYAKIATDNEKGYLTDISLKPTN